MRNVKLTHYFKRKYLDIHFIRLIEDNNITTEYVREHNALSSYIYLPTLLARLSEEYPEILERHYLYHCQKSYTTTSSY